MNSLKCFFIDFYRKIKKFESKKYKIMKKLKTLPISRNFVSNYEQRQLRC